MWRQKDEGAPLFRFQFVHPLPELVDEGLLLLLQRVFQLHLLATQLLQSVLLGVRLRLQLLNLSHQLVDQALLLLLQRLLQLHLFLSQLFQQARRMEKSFRIRPPPNRFETEGWGEKAHLIELPREVVGKALLLLLVVEGQRLLLLLECLDLFEQRVADELLLLLCPGLLCDKKSESIRGGASWRDPATGDGDSQC